HALRADVNFQRVFGSSVQRPGVRAGSICFSEHPLFKIEANYPIKERGCVTTMRDSILIANIVLAVVLVFKAGDASAQAQRPSGPVGWLHCSPVLLKDQVETTHMPTTYGSVIFKDFVPRRDATITTKMKKAGAIILGKTTMGEFAAGYLGSAFGIVRNPYDPG